jgi:hypothetical protein
MSAAYNSTPVPIPHPRYAELAAELRKAGFLVRDDEFELLDLLR